MNARRIRTLVLVLSVMSLSACDSSSGAMISSLTVTKSKIVPGDSVSVIATITMEADDPPITSGALLRGPINLGAFSLQADGTYQAMTTFAQVVNDDLAGKVGQTVNQVVQAVFRDEANEEIKESMAIALGCSEPDKAICKSQCIEAVYDHANCGGCGFVCGDPYQSSNEGFNPASLHDTACVPQTTGGSPDAVCGNSVISTKAASCNTICAAATYHDKPMQCAARCDSRSNILSPANGGDYAGQVNFADASNNVSTTPFSSCSEVPSTTISNPAYSYQAVNCCCVAQF
jgi:hypothetical protein